MSVVSLTDYRPSARYDELAWTQARVEGAAVRDGTWTEIDTFTLAPADSDPAQPQRRSFTVEPDVDYAWYRVVFIDADGDEEITTPVSRTTSGATTFRPQVSDIAALLRARTKPADGQVPLGTFTSATRPTDAEVEELIDQACAQVSAAFVGDVPESSADDARQASILRVAQWVELSYFPEQVEDTNLALTLGQQADVAMSSLVNASNCRGLFRETV